MTVGTLDNSVMLFVCWSPTCSATIVLTNPTDGRARLAEYKAAGWAFIIDEGRHRPLCPRCKEQE